MPKLRLTMAAVAAVVMLAAGCGGSGSGAKVATINGGGTDSSSSSDGGGGGNAPDRQAFQDAMLEYAQCMRDHGVDMPDPTFDGSGGGAIVKQEGPGAGVNPESQTFKDAQEACQPIMDEVEQSMPKPSPEEQAQMRDQMLAFAQCMRDHGIDMPDPTFDENGRVKIQVNGPGPDGPSSDASDGPTTQGAGPREDPAFQAALQACQDEGKGPKIGTGGSAGSDSSDS